MTDIAQKPKKKYGDDIMSEEQMRKIMAESDPAPRPKKEYVEPKKEIDVQSMYVELQALIRDAGGRAPGYMRRLDTIFNKYLV